MEIRLSASDTLSLYTEFSEEDGLPVSFPRSVIIHRPKELTKKLILIDNLSFDLFIAIPNDTNLKSLKRFMINSFCASHFNDVFVIDDAPKGYAIEEEANPMLSLELKSLLYQLDDYNDGLFGQYATSKKQRPKKQIYFNEYGEDNQEEYKYVDHEDEEAEDDNMCLNSLFTVFEKPLLMAHLSEQKQKNRPNENIYRLAFRNHYVLTFFLKLFEKKIKFHETDGSLRAIYADVLTYTIESSGPRPTCERFIGRPIQYLSSQLHNFKDKNDSVLIRFPTNRIITRGLLLPSVCYGERNTTRQSLPNTLENMFNAAVSQYKSKTVSFQTLYIDLSDASLSCVCHLVDYKNRQLVEKSTLSGAKKRSVTEKPIKNQPGLTNFFKKARIENEQPI